MVQKLEVADRKADMYQKEMKCLKDELKINLDGKIQIVDQFSDIIEKKDIENELLERKVMELQEKYDKIVSEKYANDNNSSSSSNGNGYSNSNGGNKSTFGNDDHGTDGDGDVKIKSNTHTKKDSA